MIYGATGSGKTRGFVKPFILQTARRKESMVLVDPKGEIYESMSAFLQEEGYEVRMFNLLDMEDSDAWNCLSEIEHDKDLVQSIAEVIIKNTSNANERQDFWEKAELNLLMALMHYVASQTVPGTNELLPIQQRSLGAIYRMLSNESFADLERRFDELPKGHPALPPYGIFKLANRQIWGNIAIGLGNRLSVFQNPLVDKITSYNEIDLTLPGRKPCAYFCCISAQDSSLEFLSSLFFSQLFTSLMDYGRREGDHGRLPVTVNVCLEEFCNIGKLMDFKRVLNVCRGSAIFCQIIVQSIPQLQDRYPNTEWEELIGCTDIQICLGCNDVDTATYISKKCGMVTIKVENNQMPLMPLFSPVYTSTRPYSQTKSNTQRPRDVRVADHVPLWRQEMPGKPTPPPDASVTSQAAPAQSSRLETQKAPPVSEVVQPVEEAETPSRPLSARVPEWDYGLLDPNLSSLTGEVPAQDAAYGPLALMKTSPQQVGGGRNEEGRR